MTNANITTIPERQGKPERPHVRYSLKQYTPASALNQHWQTFMTQPKVIYRDADNLYLEMEPRL